jgi:acetate CoA/acetoacetate CoA-transferase alpha subunit
MPKIISGKEAANLIKPDQKLMVGGFLVVGSPQYLIDCIIEKGVKDLSLVVIATDYDDRGIGKLVTSKQVKALQVSYIGSSKNSQIQYKNGDIQIEFVPQGILMERIRAAGAGLGGIYSPVGVGTVVAEGKETLEENGKTYILERPISADFAIIHAKKADKAGNLIYHKSARNCNPVMAMGAKQTIVEVDEIVESGEIDPDEVITPGIYVDYIVKVGE